MLFGAGRRVFFLRRHPFLDALDVEEKVLSKCSSWSSFRGRLQVLDPKEKVSDFF